MSKKKNKITVDYGEFKCDCCGKTFEKNRFDSTAMKEHEKRMNNHPIYRKNTQIDPELGIACEECFKMIKEKTNNFTSFTIS